MNRQAAPGWNRLRKADPKEVGKNITINNANTVNDKIHSIYTHFRKNSNLQTLPTGTPDGANSKQTSITEDPMSETNISKLQTFRLLIIGHLDIHWILGFGICSARDGIPLRNFYVFV